MTIPAIFDNRHNRLCHPEKLEGEKWFKNTALTNPKFWPGIYRLTTRAWSSDNNEITDQGFVAVFVKVEKKPKKKEKK